MTTWVVSVTDTFLNELLNLPQRISRQVTRKIKILERDPISAEGDAKKIKGRENVYRVRVNDYRLFYSFGQGWVKLLSIRKRDERTYQVEIDPIDPRTVPPVGETPEAIETRETIEERSIPVPVEVLPAPSLPVRLTRNQLQKWQIPRDYWKSLLEVANEDELVILDLPDRILGRIIDNLFPRPIEEIQAQPEYRIQQPEDLDRFFEGDIGAFLLKLDPEQEKYISGKRSGPILIKGGPGTGKSTIALYRVKYLLEQGYRSILFTTYTNALVKYSEQLLQQLLGKPPAELGVTVTTVDSLIYEHYTKRYGRPGFADEQKCLTRLAKAIETADIPAANIFERKVQQSKLAKLGAPYLLEEFLDVIDAWGIGSAGEYATFSRVGRGKPLTPKAREVIWSLYRSWSAMMEKDRLITWEKLRRKALEIVRDPDFRPPFDALIIDEAQDLSPVALRFLLSLAIDRNALYLTADASQSLYQRGFSWKQIDSDLQVAGRASILKRNYRNTRQIAAACTALLDGTNAGDNDCIRQVPSPHEGDTPLVWLGTDGRDEIDRLKTFFLESAKRYRLPLHGAALLCPSSQTAKLYAEKLAEVGLKAKFVSSKQIDLRAPYIKVMTLHSAKGLEFPFVAIGLTGVPFPKIEENTPPEERETAIDAQRRLFYVGCSRAMRALMVCRSNFPNSPFFESLNPPYWQKVIRETRKS